MHDGSIGIISAIQKGKKTTFNWTRKRNGPRKKCRRSSGWRWRAPTATAKKRKSKLYIIKVYRSHLKTTPFSTWNYYATIRTPWILLIARCVRSLVAANVLSISSAIFGLCLVPWIISRQLFNAIQLMVAGTGWIRNLFIEVEEYGFRVVEEKEAEAEWTYRKRDYQMGGGGMKLKIRPIFCCIAIFWEVFIVDFYYSHREFFLCSKQKTFFIESFVEWSTLMVEAELMC